MSESIPDRQLTFRTAATDHYYVLMVQPPPTIDERRTVFKAAKPFWPISEQQMENGYWAFGFKKRKFGNDKKERGGIFNDLTENVLPRVLGNVALINGKPVETPLDSLRSRPSSMGPRFRY